MTKKKHKKKLNKIIQKNLHEEIYYAMGCCDGVAKVSDEGYGDLYCNLARGIQIGLTIASCRVAENLCFKKSKNIDIPANFGFIDDYPKHGADYDECEECCDCTVEEKDRRCVREREGRL